MNLRCIKSWQTFRFKCVIYIHTHVKAIVSFQLPTIQQSLLVGGREGTTRYSAF